MAWDISGLNRNSQVYGQTANPTPMPTSAVFDPTQPGTFIPTMPTTPRRFRSVAEVLQYIQYMALTGLLQPMGSRSDVQAVLAELGVTDPRDLQQVQSSMRVRLNLSDQAFDYGTTPAQAGGTTAAPGLTNASIRAREGSSPENIVKTKESGRVRTFGPGEIWAAPWQSMSQTEFEMIQRMVYEAGYYNPETPPVWGDRMDPNFREAWFQAVNGLYASGNTLPMEQFLTQRAQAGGPGVEPIGFDTQVVNLTDAASIRTAADQIAQESMGRKLTDEEKEVMVGVIHNLEMAQGTALIGVDTENQLAAAGINMGNVAGTITSDTVLQTGNALAAQFGLAVGSHIRTPEHNAAIGGARNSDHLTGMAVDISGSQAQMAALAAWARQHEGPGQLFKYVLWQVPDHYDHVHLSFNQYVGEGADVGAVLGGGATGSGGLEQFMAATRQVESGGDYYVENSIGAYGAYQFMPGTWASAAAMAGVNPNDRSPANQDAAARALMSYYWQKYGDWRLVAAAWHGGEGAADKAKVDPNYLGSISDGNITTSDYVNRVMEAMGAGALGGMIGPNIMGIEGVDYGAELQEELRRRFPAETEAHDIALQFENFRNLALSGPSGSFGL